MNPPAAALAQEAAPPDAQLNLRKSVHTREYQGKEIAGEERTVGRGDTLWRILVQEKGLPERRFRSYLVIIRGLNPQLKNLDVLRLGDSIFIPLRPDEAVGSPEASKGKPAAAGAAPPKGATVFYRVKAGEHLYQILRDQLKITDNREVANYAALVKDLNPERKNWELLQEGEVIRLPAAGQSRASGSLQAKAAASSEQPPPVSSAPASVVAEPAKPAVPGIDPRRLPAKGNLGLLAKIVEALGGELQRAGEEVFTLKEGTLRIDRRSYPVVYSPKLQQRVVLDPEDKIPAALRTSLGDPRVGVPVVAMTAKVSVEEVVGRLLAGLGYQSLPADRPVVIQDGAVALEAQGSWMALAPEESNKAQEIYIINLTDGADGTPEYLKSQVARRGLQIKDVLVGSAAAKTAVAGDAEPHEASSLVKTWPRDKSEIVDALLLAYGVSFGVAETLSVELSDGLRIDARADRVFEVRGKRIAIFFQRPQPELKKALQEKSGIEVVGLDLASLSSRELIGKLLNALDDRAAYQEHRFGTGNGSVKDKLVVTAWGFLPSKKSIFLTDRELPQSLLRFFFEKGLEIVYFQ